MTRKEYTYFYTHKSEAPKDFWYWRNKAVKYFNLQKGEVIHHLMETKEQKDFNKKYYERWGFDLDGNMRYAIKMTKEEHDAYHVSLRKGKHNSKEHNQHVSESLKNFIKHLKENYHSKNQEKDNGLEKEHMKNKVKH